MSTLGITRASHDLNNVDVLEIYGWSGGHEVVPVTDSQWVTIEAEVRYPGEFWTFPRAKNRKLTCHTNLLSDKQLLISTNPATGRPFMMEIRIPVDKVGEVRVEFAR